MKANKMTRKDLMNETAYYRDKLSDLIKKAFQSGYLLSDIADKCDVSIGTVKRIYNNETDFRITTAMKICKGLGYELNEVFTK